MSTQLLTEELSISDQVKSLGDEIYDVISILSDITQQPYHTYSKVENLPYIEDTFTQNTHNIINGIPYLKIHFLIYFCESDLETKHLRLGCSADYEEKYISVETTCINGIIDVNLRGEIYHEIEHLFQYGNGFQKGERTNRLYDTATANATNQIHTDELGIIMERLFYMTFSHEQDAFTHQFYGQIITKEEIGTFNQELNNFQPYRDFVNSMEILKDYPKKYIRKELKDVYGYTIPTFNKRIH